MKTSFVASLLLLTLATTAQAQMRSPKMILGWLYSGGIIIYYLRKQ